MKAIYQSVQSYLQLDYGEVNRRVPVYSEGENPHIVGFAVNIELFHQRIEFYTFSEGKNHNQLTLTDPTEIRNMRDYIKWRGERNCLITEVFFEGDEAELYPPAVTKIVDKEKPVKAEGKSLDWDELSESDRKIYSNMMKR